MRFHPIDIVDRFKKHKILVLGDAILDAYIKGISDRICREAPAPVINVQEQEESCGGAANAAINLAALGADTFFLTVVGKDSHGNQLMDRLKSQGVNTDHIIQDKNRKTIAKTRISASSNILIRVDQGNTDPISEDTAMVLAKSVEALLPEVEAVVVSDYGYGVFSETMVQALATLRNKKDIPWIVDAKEPQKFKKLLPTAVKPNYEEAISMLGLPKTAKEQRAKQLCDNSKELFTLTGAKYVAATLDADGTILFVKGKKPYEVSCIPHDDKKAIGAGDTFISALALAFCSGAQARMAVEIASAAASIVIEKEGTEVCSDIELRSYFHGNLKFISSLEELVTKVKELRKEHKRIVFTNGCFDILHRGHVNFLKQANTHGDVLIVGLNSDKSIRRVKGKERPINGLEDRVAVLAGLQSVNYLIAFEEDSPVKIIEALRPDVFVKGGTYTIDALPEANLVKKLGGEIAIIPFTINLSTTRIIERIRSGSGKYPNKQKKQKTV